MADEIVVVDSGSTDRTVEIARERGAKVIVTPDWPGFGPQKNRALDLATGDWVLSLDADEWLTAGSAEEIKAAHRAHAPALPRIALPRRSSFCGRFLRHSGWWPDYVVRLFRRGSARFSDDSVHERVIVDGALGTLREPIMHETFVDLDDLVGKMNRYSTLTAQQLQRDGKIRGPRRGDRARAVGVRPHVRVPRRISRRPRRLHARAGHGGGHVLPLREAHAALPQVTAPPATSSSRRSKATRATATRWSRASRARPRFDAHRPVERQGIGGHGLRSARDDPSDVSGAGRRLPQMLFLLRRLLRRPGPIVVTTARRSDLALVDLAASGRVPPDRVFLYFHWFRETPAQALVPAADGRAAAGHRDPRHDRQRGRRVPPLRLRERRAAALSRARAGAETATVPFRRLLYAGAARQDKGFGIVVDLVELLAARKEDIPIAVQITADHYGKYDAATRADIARLEAVALSVAHADPRDALAGGVRREFPGQHLPAAVRSRRVPRPRQRRDARCAGARCPIVATAGTWSAALIEPFGAGIALADPDAESLYAAVDGAATRITRATRPGRLPRRARADADSWAPLLERLGT